MYGPLDDVEEELRSKGILTSFGDEDCHPCTARAMVRARQEEDFVVHFIEQDLEEIAEGDRSLIFSTWAFEEDADIVPVLHILEDSLRRQFGAAVVHRNEAMIWIDLTEEMVDEIIPYDRFHHDEEDS